jgi:hypothetical protein
MIKEFFGEKILVSFAEIAKEKQESILKSIETIDFNKDYALSFLRCGNPYFRFESTLNFAKYGSPYDVSATNGITRFKTALFATLFYGIVEETSLLTAIDKLGKRKNALSLLSEMEIAEQTVFSIDGFYIGLNAISDIKNDIEKERIRENRKAK